MLDKRAKRIISKALRQPDTIRDRLAERAKLKHELDAKQQHGKAVLAIEGIDCDGTRGSGFRTLPAHCIAFENAVDEELYNAEGQTWFDIITVTELEDERKRRQSER